MTSCKQVIKETFISRHAPWLDKLIAMCWYGSTKEIKKERKKVLAVGMCCMFKNLDFSTSLGVFAYWSISQCQAATVACTPWIWNMLHYLIMPVKLEKLFKIRQKCMFNSESTLNPCFKLFPHVSTNIGPTSNSHTGNLDGFTMSTWILCRGSLFICFIYF